MSADRLRAIGWYLVEQAALTFVAALATRVGTWFVGAETHLPWLWPSTGLGIAALSVLGLRAWPALLLGGALGRGESPTQLAWALAAVDTGQAVLGALVLRAWPSFRADLSRLVDAFALVVAITATAIAGALVGTIVTLAMSAPAWPSVGRGVITWIVGTGMGGLLVAPPLMSWWGYRRQAMPSPARLVELGALVLALASAGMVAYFASVRGDVHSPLEYLPFPVAIWVAMRFGVRGATAATLVVSSVALAGHVLLEPPGTAAPGERETLLIQASLAVGALTSLLVGAVTTERNETLRALAESEQRATALFTQAPDAIFMLEGEPPNVGRILAANPAAGYMHGVDPDLFAGRPLADLQPAGQQEPLQEALERAQAERVRAEFARVRGDGTEVDVEMHAQAFRVRGHRYLLAFDRDITERRRIEAERTAMEEKLRETQKLESLGLLAGGIAHDFNNLLTGILGHANLARRSTVPSEIDACLEQVEQSTERAAELCGQMLAYAGKGRFEVNHVDLSAAVHETTSLLRASIGRGVRLELQLTTGLPIVEGDLTQIRQIIMNLVLNGAEAIEGRAGVIRVTTGVMDADAAYLATTHLSPDLPEGRYVFLEVADNGRGMSEDTLGRIFDPFFSTKFTGRGLGLAAVLGIVRGHSGALKVESHEGVGTTFRLLLPASTVMLPPQTTTVDPAPIWHGRGLALIVDDEPSVRHVATRMLESMGLDVVAASTGPEAVQIMRDRPDAFAVLLLDLTMPGGRGDETYRELRAIRADVPIILMSGYSHHEAAAHFDGEDLAGFLQKPFRLERLRELVRGATSNRVATPDTAMTAGRR